MKILLLNPPFTRYGGVEGHGGKSAPLNLCYLLAYARRHLNDEMRILDCEGLELSFDDIRNELEKNTPDLLAITMPTPAYTQVLEVAKIAKDISKEILV
ncbi:MAG: hypothetical protein PHE61_06170, partial [Candidatus Omnitrophica bacterium]|nr:hypothetical protein [Candidatus Omnitrophota bacterium]